MGEKTAGVGHFTIPTSPVIGTTVAQNASANTYTAAYVQLSAAAPAAIFITGVYVQLAAGTNIPTYMSVQLATGAAASEVIVGQHNMGFGPTSGVAATAWGIYKPIFPYIPVANGVRIAAKTASSVASALSWAVTLECINQSNVVDDGTVVGTVTTVTTVTNQLTAAAIATGVWQDAVAGDFTTASSIGKSLYTSGSVPGAASGLQICGANAATTYATLTSTGAFTVNGVSAVSQTGDGYARIGAAGAGLTALGDARIANLDATISGRMATYTQPTGFLAATFPAGTVANTTNITAGTITTTTNLTSLPAITAGWLTATGIAAAALNGKGDWNIGKTGYSLTQTFPANFSARVISAAGAADANIVKVNAITVNGAGTTGSPWGP